MLATVVEWATLGKVAIASFVAGVGVTVSFSLSLMGATRMVDMRRDGRPIEAGAYAALLILGLVTFAAMVVFGIFIMTTK